MSQSDEFWSGVLATARDLDDRSYYDLLGVPSRATGEAIGEAYYAMVRKYHPDRHALETDPERQGALVRMFARIGEAYRVLSAPDKRSAYDQARREGKNRLIGEKSTARPRPRGPDPRTPQASKLYQRGKDLVADGDKRGARAQWQLAIQFEPDSAAIRQALDALDQPTAPAATPAPAPVAVAVAPERGPQSAPERSPTRPGTRPASPARTPTPVVSGPRTTVRCASWQQVAALYRRKIRGGGLVLRTSSPPAVGTAITLVARLPDHSEIELAGRVAQHIGGDKPSIRVTFENLAAEIAGEFERVLAANALPADPGLGEDSRPAQGPGRDGAGGERDRGLHAFKQQRYDEARSALGAALEGDPENDSLRALYYLALAYQARSQGNMREAQLHFQTAAHFDALCTEHLH